MWWFQLTVPKKSPNQGHIQGFCAVSLNNNLNNMMVDLNKHGDTDYPPLIKYLMAFVVVLCQKLSTCSLFIPAGDFIKFTNLCWGDVCYQLLEELFPLMLLFHFLYFYSCFPYFYSSSSPHGSSPPLPLYLMFLLLLYSSCFSLLCCIFWHKWFRIQSLNVINISESMFAARF